MDWNTGADLRLIIAGALGGFVNWLTRKTSWKDGVAQIIVGAISGVYLSPLALPALAQVFGNIVATQEELSRLSGFVIGLGGVSVTGFFLDIWHKRSAVLAALMKEKEEKGNDGR